ncbi:MAG: radical SAM protein [Candidatus Omnitrophica bacterium]|nr:radical SAM protein [Candidatus Omnitrophota bacterium]
MKSLGKYFKIIRQRPQIIPRALRGLVRATLLRQPALRGVELAVTYRCQARCAKCSAVSFERPGVPEMSLPQIRDAVRQIVSTGAVLIDITGGEPLLRADIVDIARIVGRMPVIGSLASNALLLNNSLAQDLRGAGISVMQFGISSPDAEEHDREIGRPGSFQKLLAAIELAKSRGIEVLLNAVITREVLHSVRMRQLADLAIQFRCFLSLVLPAPVGRWRNAPVTLTSDDYAILRRWLRYPFITMDTESCYRGGCPAGSEKIYISAYGDVYPCPFIQHRVGNIFETGLRELWNKTAAASYARCVNIGP